MTVRRGRNVVVVVEQLDHIVVIKVIIICCSRTTLGVAFALAVVFFLLDDMPLAIRLDLDLLDRFLRVMQDLLEVLVDPERLKDDRTTADRTRPLRRLLLQLHEHRSIKALIMRTSIRPDRHGDSHGRDRILQRHPD